MNINISSRTGVFMSDLFFVDGIKCRMHRHYKGLSQIDKFWYGKTTTVLKILGL